MCIDSIKMKIEGLQRIFDFSQSKMLLLFHLFEDRKRFKYQELKKKLFTLVLPIFATHKLFEQKLLQ